jgi:NAD(P)-dependent dehydrogenase (short-subunit alcohol dehydrogenase family)
MTSTDDTPVPDFASMLRLDGRSFVVIGAGQGIGRQAAHALAAVGARPLCVDLDDALAREVATETGGLPWCGDATKRADVDRLFADAASQLGRIDGVVDIIGMTRYGPLVDLSDEDWDWHFDIVLRHAYYAIQRGGRAMAASGGGAMVFVASVSGLSAATWHAAYGSAKAGLISLVKSAAVELGSSNVRVNAVAPGSVRTPRVAQAGGEETMARLGTQVPLGRIGEPREIAAALLFLVSDLASYVTGQTLVVDGGASIKFPFAMTER